jgi:hypothetical protein
MHYDLYEQQRPSPLMGERYKQLRELGLTVNKLKGRLNELKAYRAQHGDCDIPITYPGLGLWVLNQRDAYHFERDVYPQDCIDKLEVLGFNWNRWGRNRLKVREEAWDMQFAKLVEFMEVHGHSNISRHDKDNERLGKWIKNQLSFSPVYFPICWQRESAMLAAAWRQLGGGSVSGSTGSAKRGGSAQRNGGSTVAAVWRLWRWQKRNSTILAAAWRRRGGGSSIHGGGGSNPVVTESSTTLTQTFSAALAAGCMYDECAERLVHQKKM